MRAVTEGKLTQESPSFRLHIDRCLGCRACEPVCPAGVEYGQLLEASRAELFAEKAGRGFNYRLMRLALRHVWLHPARLRSLFSFARVLRNTGLPTLLLNSRLVGVVSRRLEFALGLLASSAPQLTRVNKKERERLPTAQHETQAVSLFSGCVTAGLFERVNEATKRVLEVNGNTVETPTAQVCCGALHAHAGDLEGARVLARQNIEAFGADDVPVITNAGGCGAMLVSYAHLLADDSLYAERARNFSTRVRDVSQQLETHTIVSGAHLKRQSLTMHRVTC